MDTMEVIIDKMVRAMKKRRTKQTKKEAKMCEEAKGLWDGEGHEKR